MPAKGSRSHRGGTPAWKRDIFLLICILRIRITPTVPYEVIAKVLSENFPSIVLQLYKTAAPREVKCSLALQQGDIKIENIEKWLAEWAEKVVVHAEKYGSKSWNSAVSWDPAVVREILRVSGLGNMSFGTASEKETVAQAKWRKEGDWRAGSVPESALAEGGCELGKVEKAVGGLIMESMLRDKSAHQLPESQKNGVKESTNQNHGSTARSTVGMPTTGKYFFVLPNQAEVHGVFRVRLNLFDISAGDERTGNIVQAQSSQIEAWVDAQTLRHACLFASTDATPAIKTEVMNRIYQPSIQIPKHADTPRIQSTLLNPRTGLNVGFVTLPEPGVVLDVPACWNRFSGQLAEIKVVEDALKSKASRFEFFKCLNKAED